MGWPQLPPAFLGTMVLITGCADLSASAPTPAIIAVPALTQLSRPNATSTIESY
jgi:hypothetical protein